MAVLTVNDKGAIQLSISHLLEEAPADMPSVIERYKGLKVTLFHHVVSSPECGYERRFGKGRVPDAVLKLSADERMKQILRERHIIGNPKGYFVNKHHPNLTATDVEEIKSVSFTLCDSEELPRHFDARGSDYGICFFHDFLESAGMRPVVYLNDLGTPLEQRQLVFNAPHLLEVQSSRYDMRWENEWRIKGRMSFTSGDVAFLFVPDAVYDAWIHWLIDENLDYVALPSSMVRDPLTYLRLLPKMEHCSWHQIELFGGLLMNFEEFLPYTSRDREQMEDKAGVTVSCLVKAEMQQLYEERFVKRHRSFIRQLRSDVMSSALMDKLARVEANANQPWLCSIDLAKTAYEALFEIQRDRIKLFWGDDD